MTALTLRRVSSCRETSSHGQWARGRTIGRRIKPVGNGLAEPFAGDTLQREIISAVERLDGIRTAELTDLLGAVSPTPIRPRSRGRL